MLGGQPAARQGQVTALSPAGHRDGAWVLRSPGCKPKHSPYLCPAARTLPWRSGPEESSHSRIWDDLWEVLVSL